MSKETVFSEMTPSTDEVESLQKPKFSVRKTKLKPGWKLACTTLCTIALMLECTNVILTSNCNKHDQLVRIKTDGKNVIPRALPVPTLSSSSYNHTDLCSERREFRLRVGGKRVNVCSYEGRVRIDIREFLNDQPTIRGIYLSSGEYIALKAVLPLVRDELLRQMKLLRTINK